MNTVIIVQARSGSTRLPGKIFLPLAGLPLLLRLLERVSAANAVYRVVVATTVLPEDDDVEMLCRAHHVRCFRGHPSDLLDRHYKAAIREHADIVVKIPSDCPLIDPAIIDRVVSFFAARQGMFDYVSNLHPASYPDGNDVEVMTMDALAAAWRYAQLPYEREHTTPFFLNHPEMFRLGNVAWERNLDFSRSHRWTIDYPEDYLLIREVYLGLWTARRPVFGINDILRYLSQHPECAHANDMHIGTFWWDRLPELATTPWAVRNHEPSTSSITSSQALT